MKRYILILAALQIALHTFASDTIRPVSFSDTCALAGNLPDLVTYKTQLGGYICGNNALNTPEKAQKYYWTDSMKTLTAVAFWFGQKKQAPFPGLVRAKVYSVNAATGTPADLLGESNLLSVGNIDTSDNLSVVPFGTPVTLPDTFFVALDVSLLSPGDSVGLLSTRNGCYSGEQLAWEMDSTGAWVPMNDGTNITSWGLDIDMAIFPVGDFGLHTSVHIGSVQTSTVYPNPASEKIRIDFEKETGNPVALRIFNLQGKVVHEEYVQGKLFAEIDIQEFTAGVYFLETRSVQHSVMQKISIVR